MKVGADKRTYRQGARADAARQTHRAILDATQSLATEKPLAAITLSDVAERAGVTVQTVLRRFGGRDRLITAAVEHFTQVVVEQRRVPAGDVDSAVEAVVAHYETFGDVMLLLLGQEGTDPQARQITAQGRALHQCWVAESFQPSDEMSQALLVVATDLYTWKLLRRDRSLSESEVVAHIRFLCHAVIDNRGALHDG